MATTVDTLLVRIEADMSDLKQSLAKVQNDVDKSSKGIAGSFKKIGTAMKAAVAAVVVREAAQAAHAMINLASDIEEMQGKSKVVFGEFRDQVVTDLEAFGDAVGRSTFELEGMASSIQDTFVPMGFARGEAAKLSVELTKLAVDVASFNNASDTETMAAFQSALVGNHETVRQFGIVITQATLDQELMRMGIEKGVKAATEAEKVQARLNLITQGTSDAHGDAARTSGSYANQMRALKAQVSELAGELGEILLPVVNKIVAAMISGTGVAKTFLQNIGLLSRYEDGLSVVEQRAISLREEIKLLEKAQKQRGPRLKIMDDADPNSLLNMKKRLLETLEEEIEAEQNLKALRGREDRAFGNNMPPPAPPKKDDDVVDPDKVKELEKQRTALAELRAELDRSFNANKDLEMAIYEGDKAAELSARRSMKLNELKKKFPDIANENIEALRKLADTEAKRDMANIERKNKISEAESAASQALSDYNAVVSRGTSFVEGNVHASVALEKTLKDVALAYDSGAISSEQFREAQATLNEQIAETEPLYKTLKDTTISAFGSIGDAFADALVNGKSAMDGLKDTFKNFVKVMISKALELYVFNHILNAAFGLSGTNALPTRSLGAAGGGAMYSNQPRLVGERGPELFIPNAAGTLMNNMNTKSALGGGGGTVVNQVINVDAGVSQTVRAEMMSLLPRFKQDTMAAVVDAKRRGGSFGQAFG